MNTNDDFYMIHWYLQKGHSLNEIPITPGIEKNCYMASMIKAQEDLKEEEERLNKPLS